MGRLDATDEVKRLHNRLLDVAKEIGFRRGPHENAELNAMDKKACEDAAAMLHKLETEVFRLREGIGCYLHGRLERHTLRKIMETWNDD